MKLPLSLAEKLLTLVDEGQMPASKLKHAIVDLLLSEGVLAKRIAGRTKITLYIPSSSAFEFYIYMKWGITNLRSYISTLKDASSTRADLIEVSNDSKTVVRRSFSGFLVNSYMPVSCTLNGEPFLVHPPLGTYQFIHDYEQFIPSPDVTIIGIENPEVFSNISRVGYLFESLKTLFISRYPQEQGRDVRKWLRELPNNYLHFGDFDLAGINIYLVEHKHQLEDRAAFFIPGNIEELIVKYGNGRLYDKQRLDHEDIAEPSLQRLIALIHKHKKGLEQEALLIGH